MGGPGLLEHRAMVMYTPAAVVWLLHNKSGAAAAPQELKVEMERLVAAIEVQDKAARTDLSCKGGIRCTENTTWETTYTVVENMSSRTAWSG